MRIGGNQRMWYRTNLKDDFQQSGNEFEKRVCRILRHIYPDFIDPVPYGRDGDFGCDGIAEGGTHVFAIYGAEAPEGDQSYLSRKVRKDFGRALEKWPTMTKWTFVTNKKVGPVFVQGIWNPLCAEHGVGSSRPVAMSRIGIDELWDLMVDRLDEGSFDLIYPGIADAGDFKLSDFIDVVESIVSGQSAPIDDMSRIEEVSIAKLDYNKIPEIQRLELSEGRKNAWEIEEYFREESNVEQGEVLAARLRQAYGYAKSSMDDPADVMRSLYIKIGGRDYIGKGSRRIATVHAIAAHFFDSCDIFEAVPDGWGEGGGDEK